MQCCDKKLELQISSVFSGVYWPVHGGWRKVAAAYRWVYDSYHSDCLETDLDHLGPLYARPMSTGL